MGDQRPAVTMKTRGAASGPEERKVYSDGLAPPKAKSKTAEEPPKESTPTLKGGRKSKAFGKAGKVDKPRYPRYFIPDTPKSTRPAPVEGETTPVEGKEASGAVVDDETQLDGEGRRPRRHRKSPQLFIDYRQVNELAKEEARASRQDIALNSLSTPMEKDPYKDVVFWAKFAGHPFWPSRMCTEDEIVILETVDKVSLEKTSAKYGNTPVSAVVFLGSKSKGVVKTSDVLPYAENFERFTKKGKMGPQFAMGLEEADAIVLRNHAEKVSQTKCQVCQLKVDRRSCFYCERCVAPVHQSCSLREGVQINDDIEPSSEDGIENIWFCVDCERHAPQTVKAKKDVELRKRKKAAKRKSLTPSSSVPQGPPAKKKKNGGSSKQPTIDYHDDFCFLCKDGGHLLLCDYPDCPRSYHEYCVSGCQPSSNEKDPWFCPWHTCAVCGTNEDEDMESNNDLVTTNGTGNIARKRLGLPPPVGMIKHAAGSSTEDLAMNGVNTADTSPFIRCATCPMGLCHYHHTSARPLFDGENHKVPAAVSRPVKKGFFKCVYCCGNSPTGESANLQLSPVVKFHSILSKIWSRTVNGQERLCEIFMHPILECDVPTGAKDAWNALQERNLNSMMDVRERIWKLRYKTFAEFQSDVQFIADSVETILGTDSEIIGETARTLPILLESITNRFKKELIVAEADMREYKDPLVKDDISKGGGALKAGRLHPSVTMKIKVDPTQAIAPPKRTPKEWERYLENISFKDAKKMKDPGSLPARDETLTVASSLLLAAKSVHEFQDTIPPSMQSLQEMLDTQSTLLRSALRSTAAVRNAVITTLEGYDDIGTPSDGIVTLGEMRLAAEYRLANRNLKERVNKLTVMLNLERKARIEARNRVVELERHLGKSSSLSENNDKGDDSSMASRKSPRSAK
uniref:PWWP domain-containing protein n=1 Tax=Mucochytrium quahogii TaxID=96639 RepID=A0A7S2SB72_9STRA|mmetsp:Transcript_5485/g.9760  ORF Transcript_5485/g.9760 Transcript_5485/m.9760 type:complete len:912 (-) Transcript_5485:1506-4241(-)